LSRIGEHHEHIIWTKKVEKKKRTQKMNPTLSETQREANEQSVKLKKRDMQIEERMKV